MAGIGDLPAPGAEAGESELVPRRPRSLGSVIGAAFALYRRYPMLLFVLAAGVVVPYDLIHRAGTASGPFLGRKESVAAGIIWTFAGTVILEPLISALHVHAVGAVRDGEVPHLGTVAARGLRVFPVVVAAAIMSSLGIAAGLVALIVPGLILYFRWFLVAQVAAIDNDGWLEALRGSRRLTADHYGSIFLLILYFALIGGIALGTLSIVFGAHETSAVSFVISVVVHIFTASLVALTTALFYFDLIARRDAARSETSLS